jgi:hypothetical protein
MHLSGVQICAPWSWAVVADAAVFAAAAAVAAAEGSLVRRGLIYNKRDPIYRQKRSTIIDIPAAAEGRLVAPHTLPAAAVGLGFRV